MDEIDAVNRNPRRVRKRHAGDDVNEPTVSSEEHRRVLDRLELVTRNLDEVVIRWRILPRVSLEYISPTVERILGRSAEAFHANPRLALEVVIPEDREVVQQLLQDPTGALRTMVVRWRHVNGQIVWGEHRRVPVLDERGRVVAVEVVIRDVTREKELEQQRDAHAALTQALVSHLHDGLLAETSDGSIAIANRAFCTIFNIRRHPQELTGLRTSELREQLHASGIAPPEALDACFALHTHQEHARLVLNDGRTLDCRYVPISIAAGDSARLWQFSDVTAITSTTAALIESKKRLRQLSAHAEAVREDERRTIAHALHDDLGQLVTNMRLELAAAIRLYGEHPRPEEFEVVDRLQAIAGLLDVEVKTLRGITTALRPPVLDQLGLAAAMEWESRMFATRTGIRSRVRVTPATLTVADETATALYRILLEALNNVAKHAHAGRVWITIRHVRGALFMTVRDNGSGITDAEIANPATMGLLGMRERALAVGGDVRIYSPTSSGTRVVVVVPDGQLPSARSRRRSGKGRPHA